MSMPVREGGLPRTSTTTMTSTPTPQTWQYDLWTEPPVASQIARRAGPLAGLHAAKKLYAQYPLRPSTPTPSLSFKELCNNYPNHLDGDLLIEMSDAGLKPRDIVEMMPAATRDPHLGTELSFITDRLKKARARESAGKESTLQPKQAPTTFMLDHRVATTGIYPTIAQDHQANASARRVTISSTIPAVARNNQENTNTSTSVHLEVTPNHSNDTGGTMITAGDQFSFRNEEKHHKEALREEIRKHLTLLVKVSSPSVDFISKGHPEQENDILLQWKQWCDGQCLALARRHEVFVGPSLAGLVINDSLTRLLGTLTMIHMKQNGNGCTVPVLADRSHALADAEWLCYQYTRELQARAGQLFPSTPVSPPPPTPPPTSPIFNAPGGRHGDNIEVQSTTATTTSHTEESISGQLSHHSAPPPAPSSTATASLVLRRRRRSGGPRVGRACAGCREAKRGCDRARPACGNCIRTVNSCNYG